MSLRVVVLSQYEIISSGVTAVLGRYPDRVEVVVAGSAEAPVDIALWSSFGAPRSFDGLDDMRSSQLAARLVVLCWDFETGMVERALAAGASGYLGTSLSGEELVGALERVHAGDVVVAPGPPVPAQPGPQADPSEVLPAWPGSTHGLSEREADIVALISAGLSNDDIAQQLFLSINTVKSYIRSAYRKMGVSSRSQAVLWGVENGFRHRAPHGADDLV